MIRSLFLLLLVFNVSAPVSAGEEAPQTIPRSSRVARTWHGKVANGRAGEYEAYLTEQVKGFSSIAGNQGYTVLKETRGDETHFMVISFWDSRKSIEAYAGKNIDRVHALPRDKEFLKDPESTVMNYEIITRR